MRTSRIKLGSGRLVSCAEGSAMLARLALVIAMVLAGSASRAQTYPDRLVTLVVPYAAGGSSDVLGRLIGERLSKSLGQAIVIDNRAGAGSRIGTELVAKSA